MSNELDNITTTTTETQSTEATQAVREPKTVKINAEKFAAWKLGQPTERSKGEGFDGTKKAADFDAKLFKSEAYKNVALLAIDAAGKFAFAPQINYDLIQRRLDKELPKGVTVKLRYVARSYALKLFRSDEPAGTYRVLSVATPVDLKSAIKVVTGTPTVTA